MALVRNLIDGCEDSIEYVFAEDGIVLNTIGRQLQNISTDEIGVQVSLILFLTFEYAVCSKGSFILERKNLRNDCKAVYF